MTKKAKSEREIHNLFRTVIPDTSNYFHFSKEKNLIRLEGVFCSDELREIARVMDDCHKHHKNLD